MRSPNTILLASALLWLSNNWESTVSLKSYTGRHKHSLGGSTTGFVPGPGSGSPSQAGSQKFWSRRRGGLFTGAPPPFVTDGRPRGTSGDVRLSREVARSRSAVAPETNPFSLFFLRTTKALFNLVFYSSDEICFHIYLIFAKQLNLNC